MNYLIVGISSAIGKELGEQLLAEGHSVYGTYNSNKPENSEFKLAQVDVLDDDPDLSFLPDELHGIAYCPGSITLKPFKRISGDDFLNDYNLQVVGAVRTIQASLKSLSNADHGSIVLFSTVAVQTGLNFHSLVSSSKGAIEGLTRALSAELAPKVRVNAIAPSLTDTPMAESLLSSDKKREANADRHPLKRIGTPTDMANMALFLLTERSSWMTGQILKVDGGLGTIKG